MGKKRQTARTGDKKLYASRESEADSASSRTRGNDSDDDAMYNEVDRYHNKRVEEEYLRLDKGSGEGEGEGEEDDGITHDREGVFDLGVGGSSEDEDDSDDDTSEEEDSVASSEEEEEEVSSDDDIDLDAQKTNVLDWGSRKSSYYHGDTADLEIGQDEEDAELEEEAVREVVKARNETMDEGDFLLDEVEETDDEISGHGAAKGKPKSSNKRKASDEGFEMLTTTVGQRRSKLAKLSKSERLKVIRTSHPELLPLLSHFRDGAIANLSEETEVLCGALLEDANSAEAVGTTKSGLKYLITKAMLQTSTALNVCQYLLLKADSASRKGGMAEGAQALMGAGLLGGTTNEDEVRGHPVIKRLNQLNDLAEKLAADVTNKSSDMPEQIKNLVQATALMKDDVESDDDASDANEEAESETSSSGEDFVGQGEFDKSRADPSDDSENDSSDEEDESVAKRKVLLDAKFGLRAQDIENAGGRSGSKSGRIRRLAPSSGDFGDEDGDEENINAAGRSLAITVNSISQRGSTKQKKAGAAAMNAPENEDEDDERLMRGLEMMDAEMGNGSDGDDTDDDVDNELDDGIGDDFYSRIKAKSNMRKGMKKSKYTPAPKYPVIEGTVDGERALGNFIMKNRGLVAHKSKLNRNPRVKKREQYRRALIKRKGAVREVRVDEAHKYGGETTGIKSGLSRSRKL